VPRQVLRSLGFAAAREISGSGDHDKMDLPADPHGDHVVGEILAGADSGVETFRNDVDRRGVDGDFDIDLGIKGEEARERLFQDQIRCRRRHAETKRSGRIVSKFARGFQRSLILVQRRPQPLSRRSPAAVGATERVVRSTRRTPRRSSRLRTMSLTRGVDRPKTLPALVKLFCSSAVTKALVLAMLTATRSFAASMTGRRILISRFDDESTLCSGFEARGRCKNSAQFMLRSITISIRSAISSLAKSTSNGEPARWLNGAHLRLNDCLGPAMLRHAQSLTVPAKARPFLNPGTAIGCRQNYRLPKNTPVTSVEPAQSGIWPVHSAPSLL
jgi:hypothetical protein